ncbi:PQQ-dependent catabolism-associated beta-propeller protein [Pelagibacterium nitratireducens]|uniref:PQQ-dependent catabolism-associated beta-propeller protein n=1 Tax=Pelagibacterium nitratireducens TaxID=1046114 RepID=A0ABZ2I4V4_9HYPH
MSVLPILRTGALHLAGALVLGLCLGLPASAAGTGYVFVSNERSDSVWVFDPANDFELVAEIPTSSRPRDMQFNIDRTRLYVACGDDDVIDVIDVASLSVVDYVPTGRSPEMFVLNENETQIFVSNEENSTAQVIDVASKVIIHEIPTGAEPEGVLLTEDETTLYVTSEIADMVHVIDTASGTVVDNVIVGTRPRRFELVKDDTELWVSDELSGSVTIIDAATNEVIDQLQFLPPGFREVDVTPVGILLSEDGQTMYVTLGRANHIAYVDVETREIEDYTLVGSRAWSLALSAEGTQLYVTNGLSDDMSVIDLETRSNVRSIPTGRVPHSIVVDDEPA